MEVFKDLDSYMMELTVQQLDPGPPSVLFCTKMHQSIACRSACGIYGKKKYEIESRHIILSCTLWYLASSRSA